MVLLFTVIKKRGFFMMSYNLLSMVSVKNLSAGTLSFELSVLGEKIITNCGASESSGKKSRIFKI